MKLKVSKLFRMLLTEAGIVLQVLKLSLEVKGIVKRSFPLKHFLFKTKTGEKRSS